MNFGFAVEALKAGQRVAREGWNGKGMFIFLINGSNKLASVHGFGFGEYVGEPTFSDTVFIRTPKHTLVAWVCSQEDMLAEDWRIVE